MLLLYIFIDNFQMSNSEQTIEAAGKVEELVCCLVRMAPLGLGCHNGLYHMFDSSDDSYYLQT